MNETILLDPGELGPPPEVMAEVLGKAAVHSADFVLWEAEMIEGEGAVSTVQPTEQVAVAATEDDTFDELVGMLADTPTEDTSDKLVAALHQVFADAEALQDISRISEMAMMLGAMACLHPHLEGLSSEISARYLRERHDKSDGHSHEVEDEEESDGEESGNGGILFKQVLSLPKSTGFFAAISK